MNDIEFKYKHLNIDSRWEVVKNEFIDLDPDNDYPIDEYFITLMRIFSRRLLKTIVLI
jgi:hypothetical protein